MTVAAGPAERDVIPRWRTLSATVASGELGQAPTAIELDAQGEEELRRARRDWEADPSVVSRAELVSAGLILGVPELVEDAAESTPDDSSLPVGLRRLLTRAVLSRRAASSTTPTDSSLLEGPALWRQAAALKVALQQDPRRSVAWLELGRIHATLGQQDSAWRAIRTAMGLAPNSQFMLRAASCFLVNIKESDRAHDLLVRSPATQHDPWLMAAEIATAHAADRRPTLLKRGRQLLEAGNYPERSLSELASEVGSFELRAGADRRARVLLKRAMSDPTENAVAQVEWASRQDNRLELPARQLRMPAAHEARAQHGFEVGDWTSATASARSWLADQPFSTIAAVVASYGAMTGLLDFELGRDLAIQGLLIDPDDPGLLNNAAYAFIELGEYGLAGDYLRRAVVATTASERVALLATAGMLLYRLGDVEQGREGYREAIRAARARRDRDREAMAAVMMAREEILSGGAEVEALRGQAERLAKQTTSAAVKLWLSFVSDNEADAKGGRRR